MKNKIQQPQFLSRLTQWAFILLFMFPILPKASINVLFIVFAFLVGLSCIYVKPIGFWNQFKKNVIITVPFIPYLFEYFLHLDNKVAGFELEKKLLFFVAPVLVGLYRSIYKLKSLRTYMYAYSTSIAVLTAYSIARLILQGVLFSPTSFDNGARVLRRSFEEVSYIHPTYFSLFAVIVILWFIYDWKNQEGKGKVLYFLSGGLIVYMQLLLAARMTLIALALSSFYLIYKVTTQKRELMYKYAILVTIIVAVPFVVPSVKNRILDAKSILLSYTLEPEDMDERIVILDCDAEIFKENMWTGVGSRNAQSTLNNCYMGKKPAMVTKATYNAHNQFFTVGINYGIFCLAFFVFSALYFIKALWNSPFAIVCIGSTILVMLTESILERQWGVYFYILFFLLLYNVNAQETKEE